MQEMSTARQRAGVALGYAAVGFSPIAALALAIAEFCRLTVSASVLIGLASVGAVFLVRRFPSVRRAALEGFCAGLLAVFGYDIARWLTIAAGWWGDFIPSIGGWLLGTQQPDVLLGYLYRWLGDGGGMGMAFVVAIRLLAPALGPRSRFWLGIAYGVAIWWCLIATLMLSSEGQRLLFPVTPVTLALSLGGHLIYGGLLGAWTATPGMRGALLARVDIPDLCVQDLPADFGRARVPGCRCHRPSASQHHPCCASG
jgi:hypothetical protein